jgi:AraC-like DNA-binding protein
MALWPTIQRYRAKEAPTMANPNQHARSSGTGQYVRTPETAARDARAAELRAEGWTLKQIADELGYSDKTNAQRGIRRTLKEIVQGPAEKLLQLETERLESLYEEALKVLERDHATVSHGKIIKDDDGNPILDDGPKLAAIDRCVKIRESYRRLHGLDKPVKVDATVTEITQEDVALQELVAEMRAKNAAVEEELRTQRGQAT